MSHRPPYGATCASSSRLLQEGTPAVEARSVYSHCDTTPASTESRIRNHLKLGIESVPIRPNPPQFAAAVSNLA